ncbi:hypothetical protein [Secundilactobacillus silagei]|uniref:hypothetical protein n=1 Tax=Secundilactobacillus silagei TaxID=1293415 RepID=UPI0006D0C4F3|nr:hypothetical protein [Secundilactobacillus silagei]
MRYLLVVAIGVLAVSVILELFRTTAGFSTWILDLAGFAFWDYFNVKFCKKNIYWVISLLLSAIVTGLIMLVVIVGLAILTGH